MVRFVRLNTLQWFNGAIRNMRVSVLYYTESNDKQTRRNRKCCNLPVRYVIDGAPHNTKLFKKNNGEGQQGLDLI